MHLTGVQRVSRGVGGEGIRDVDWSAVGKSLSGKDEQLKLNAKYNKGPVRQVQKTKKTPKVQHFKLSQRQSFRQGVLKRGGYKSHKRKHLVQNLVEVVFFLLDTKTKGHLAGSVGRA